ncbi:CaiB/BaiF CoA transferase family protein [Metabacillus arenae]|uniref:CoA transferase n=1 Tax=Metabacillus arenae TaxID=2771434 RepID=A0A926NII7_9BACI|nr:CoA transferase [Metabacillus arenae]MBD1381700.1 CoA transferase [Metabacillus arenae]
MKKVALKGITILEIGDQLTQFAGKLLADMGAQVIKVEPSEGAPSRNIGPFYKDIPDKNGSLYFWNYNTSKKSITLDIDTKEGQEKILSLLDDADVILEGNKPGQMKEWGLDYDTLSRKFPGLVYCSVTPFGQDGPWSNYQSSDIAQLALGGIMAATGYDDIPDAPPIAPTGGQSFHLTGYFAAMGIVSALLYRDFKSQGQYIDISVHDCVTVSTEMSLPYWIYQKEHVIRQTGRHALPNRSVRWNLKCKDGKYILVLNTYLDVKRWKSLVSWLSSHQLEEDLGDERYTNDKFRAERMEHVTDVLERFCNQFESEYIYHTAQSIGLPWAPVRAPEDMIHDKHLNEDRNVFASVYHPELNESLTYPGAPYKFYETPWNIKKRPPLLGEHNDEVLHSLNTKLSN